MAEGLHTLTAAAVTPGTATTIEDLQKQLALP